MRRIRFAFAYFIWAIGWPKGALAILGGWSEGEVYAAKLLRARALASIGDTVGATREFYRCAHAKPRHGPTLMGLVGSLFNHGAIDVADRVAALAIEANPTPRTRRIIAAMRARAQMDMEIRASAEIPQTHPAQAHPAQAHPAQAHPANVAGFPAGARIALAPAMLLKLSRTQRSEFLRRIGAITKRDVSRDSPARSEKPSNDWGPPRLNYLDMFYVVAHTLHAVIVNKIARAAAINPSSPFVPILRTFGMIVGHLYLWWIAGRSMPSGLSSITFTLPAFSSYLAFTSGFQKAAPREATYPVFAGRRVGPVAFIVGDMVWEILCVFIGTALSLAYCLFIVPGMFNFEPIHCDVPAHVELIVLAYLIGLSVQAVVHQIVRFIPSLHSLTHLLGPAIFITSGVYESYVSEPVQMQLGLWYNPIASVVEFSRQAYAPGYSTGNLSLKYSIAWAIVGTLFFILNYTSPIASTKAGR